MLFALQDPSKLSPGFTFQCHLLLLLSSIDICLCFMGTMPGIDSLQHLNEVRITIPI